MSESAKTPSTPTNPVLVTKTPVIEENSFVIAIEKRHFAHVWSFSSGQKRQKYNPITSTTLKNLT